MRLLNEGDDVEYLEKNLYYKATLHGGYLCDKDRKYHTFMEFIRAAKKLKPSDQPSSCFFYNLKINGMTYTEVRDKIYKLIFCEDDDTSLEKSTELPVTNTIETVPWSDSLESRLCQLYARNNIVDIFWGLNLKEDDATWCVYVVTRNLLRQCEKIEKIGDQVINFIAVEEGFASAEIPPQSPHDPLPTWKKTPKKLQKAFDEALDNELGPSFRKMHYNLVGMSTGYKRTQGKFTEISAILLYVRQKGILRRGCVKFPDEIRGYPTDIVEACVATPYGFGASACQSYQEKVMLGSSIGIIESQGTSGTLSAVVYDKNPRKIGILSCEHVCRFNNSSAGKGVIIYQPSHRDIDGLKESFVEMARVNKAYTKFSEEMCTKIEEDRKKSALAFYERGIRGNFFSKIHNRYFGIDAAFCIASSINRTLCPNKFSISQEDFKKAKLSEDTYLKDFYELEELEDVVDIDVFKVGKATGLTFGKLVPIYSAVSIDLRHNIESVKKNGEIPSYSKDVDKRIFADYMKTPLVEKINEMRQQCYPTVWFDRQLIFDFKHGDFVPGDSGASVVDKEGKALGILHAAWITENSSYAIASPYFAVFEALDVESLDRSKSHTAS
ncbi:15720_t:CDS:2 [Acaulospora morrowiae]|uniref:15720_t:CDS:1 n=1 Tax=Acaulospora morrowiae TaxID=94023 RepID=A0A9N9D074_9GLOM|nr:15720_t:CDS:2 [Acaulospora morrowiae]